METMESAEKAVQAIQELDFGEDICCINRHIQKIIQNYNISNVMIMERP